MPYSQQPAEAQVMHFYPPAVISHASLLRNQARGAHSLAQDTAFLHERQLRQVSMARHDIAHRNL